MIPFGDFIFFGLLLYAVVPTIFLGLVGWTGRWWTLLVTLVMLVLLFSNDLAVRPNFDVREIWIVLGYALFQVAVAAAFLRWKSRATFYAALALAVLPLAVAKALPALTLDTSFGFLGISYVTFRALDVIFSIHDGVIKTLPPTQHFAFLFFFPAVSSGPIDRYRRFGQDWLKTRTRSEFLDDLDFAISRIFRGFLYKFIIAALVHAHWVVPVSRQAGALHQVSLMYAETFYLFFDFAGYSAFAIGFSRLFGIRTPENFNAPFLAQNIREFWTRWHMTLSAWFRDHVHMRFLLAATKGKWFAGKNTANYLGLCLTFGLMGLWHGPELRFLLYGAYHAALLCGFEWFSRWNKTAKVWGSGPVWRAGSIVLTFHAFAFGIMLFNGHLTPQTAPRREEAVETCTCRGITGVLWDKATPGAALQVDIYVDYTWVARVSADEYREDLKERGMGTGRHAFHYDFESYVRNGRSHTIEARVVGPNRYLRGTPAVITCEPDEVEEN
jgi:membrane protein involved in D-alanine export